MKTIYIITVNNMNVDEVVYIISYVLRAVFVGFCLFLASPSHLAITFSQYKLMRL